MKNLTENKIRKMKERKYQNKLRSHKKHLINQQEKKEKFFRVNKVLQFVEMSNRLGSLRNCLRWNKYESKEHIMRKLELCMELKFIGHEFLTEAIFKNGRRCDVIDLSDGTIYEILHSETDKMFKINKIDKYPPEFKVVRIRC